MRARNLKPGFFKNEQLGSCGPWARLLFEGLWCLADREGRLEERQQRIKVEIFPYDNLDVEVLLQELATAGLIIRYAIGSCKYITIPTFLLHQKPHVREAESVIPPPPTKSRSRKSTTKVGASTDLGRCEPALNPESLMHESPMAESNIAAAPPVTNWATPFYEEFRIAFRTKYDWEYQKKTGDFVQLAALKKSENGSLLERWPRAVKNYLASPQREHTLADLVVHFATFQKSALNQYGKPLEEAERSRDARLLDETEALYKSYGNEATKNGPVH